MIAGMIGLILVNGLGFFWPRPLVRADADRRHVAARRDRRPRGDSAAGHARAPERPSHPAEARQPRPDRRGLPLGRRSRRSQARSEPARRGVRRAARVRPVHRQPVASARGRAGDRAGADAVWQALQPLIAKAAADRDAHPRLERDEIGAINYRDRSRAAGSCGGSSSSAANAQPARATVASARDRAAAGRRCRRGTRGSRRSSARRRREASRTRVTSSRPPTATEKELPTLDIFRAYRANELSFAAACGDLRAAACGSSCPAIRASRTPKAASSRRSSAP